MKGYFQFLSKSIIITCLIIAFINVQGCVYSKVKAPMTTQVQKTEFGTKVGKASIYSVLWSVAWGDASTYKAAKNGHLKRVHHLDVEQFTVLFGLYTRTTTIAYGD